ncbi:HupE/UreJ family protein [Flavobacterium sp. ASW18X]|uniref:HupE/UreJ family protein n=1 Tax=Flavobacterium sp. ASW18X TaxID=2572595 RepID=UPI002684741D
MSNIIHPLNFLHLGINLEQLMNDFGLYLQLGVAHVLDFAAYDHILFLSALAIPYGFKKWRLVVLLATIFTIAHCISLALSAFDILRVDASWIEFLIPVTIAFTAIFNVYRVYNTTQNTGWYFTGLATAFFGLIHGFGFSNYFNMMMAEAEDKITPLLGFATGIEVSQLVIILSVLMLHYIIVHKLNLASKWFVLAGSILILGITIPMLIETFPL